MLQIAASGLSLAGSRSETALCDEIHQPSIQHVRCGCPGVSSPLSSFRPLGRAESRAGRMSEEEKQVICAELRRQVPIDLSKFHYMKDSAERYLNGMASRYPNGRHPTHDNKRVRNARRRLAEAQASLLGDYDEDQWYALLEGCSFSCVICGCILENGSCADHIIPVTRGGSNSIRNIQPVCRECNSSNKFNHTDCRPDWIRGIWG